MIQISDNISIKTLELRDSVALFDLIEADRSFLRKWLPFVDMVFEEQDTRDYVESVLNTDSDQFIILYDGLPIGLAGFNYVELHNRRLDIGYWMAEKYQGKGIMLQVVGRLMKIAFEEMDIHRVRIRAGIDNVKSRNIPEKLGFTLEGVERDGELLVDNKFTDLAIYGLLKNEYREN